MTNNEDISKPFKVIERQTLEVENGVEKNKYFTILFFSQLYTQLDTCQKFHPYMFDELRLDVVQTGCFAIPKHRHNHVTPFRTICVFLAVYH